MIDKPVSFFYKGRAFKATVDAYCKFNQLKDEYFKSGDREHIKIAESYLEASIKANFIEVIEVKEDEN